MSHLPWRLGFLVRAVARALSPVLVVFLLAGTACAWQGRVVKVLDGDTVQIMNCHGKSVRIHLYGVEAPQTSQYFGQQSARYFAGLVGDRTVEVVNIGRDERGRMRSLVWADGVSVNEEMVRAGYAWVSNPLGLSPSCERWLDVQQMARASGIGIWNALNDLPNQGLTPVPPRSAPAARGSM